MTDSQYNSVNDLRLQQLLQWVQQLPVDYNKVSTLSTDAGTRRYFRLHSSHSTVLAVDAAPEFEDTRAFIEIAKRIDASGVRVPQIYHYNLEKGFLLIEDFGDIHVQQQSSHDAATREALYRQAMDDLITLQQTADTTGLPCFDAAFIRHELAIFEDWFLQKHLQLNLTAELRRQLDRLFELIIESCSAQPQAFMHRDYHCRNLMVVNNQKLAVIDFQGAMLGPVTYDPGSLLKDAYINIESSLQTTLCNTHRQSLAGHTDEGQYRRWYDVTAMQRHLKILGIFCRLNYRDNKPNYMQHLPTVSRHILHTAGIHDNLTPFRPLLNQLLADLL
jgi:aminoglycoside/choline kinase family phosphotransferase